MWYCTRVFLAVRIGLGLLAAIGAALLPVNPPSSVPGWDPPPFEGWSVLVTAWERFDALWYLRIADTGYRADDGSAAFFPLYPLIVRGVSVLVGGRPLLAALLVTNIAALGALVLVMRLTQREWGVTAARRTVLYLSVFPTALFLVAPYAEALFLLLAAATFIAARSRRWAAAAVLGALAAATRPLGVLLALAVAVEAFRPLRERDRVSVASGLGAALFVPCGLLAYFAWWQWQSGNALQPLTAQGGWQRVAMTPVEALVLGVRDAFRYPGLYPGGYSALDLVLVVVALVAAVWVVRRTAASYGVWTVASILMPLALVFEPRPFMSLPRFILPLFPLFWALARAADRFGIHDGIVAASACGLGVFTLLFVNWYYVF